ncbi:Uncharacterised protein [Staphylococcus gallinarum]|uniref:Uncharacterized protein n=1 Tax=Staphylococcus gallinarum TaxID=1293 RepID=A0A380FL29_STAGA|nr:Uncharacterised protein [Staphylococcus gallinarum]
MDRRLLDDQFQQDEHEFGVFARYLVLILIHKTPSLTILELKICVIARCPVGETRRRFE